MYFTVTHQAGPAWDPARPMREQELWPEHAAFIDRLAEEGFALLAGPLGDPDMFADRVHRAMLVVHADSADEARTRLAPDPWKHADILTVVAIDRWNLLIGEIKN